MMTFIVTLFVLSIALVPCLAEVSLNSLSDKKEKRNLCQVFYFSVENTQADAIIHLFI